MIDWLTLRILGQGHLVRSGVVMCVGPDGEIEWQSPQRVQVEGSWSSKVGLRHHTFDGSLEISGNPAKWLQGHNVFGSDDLVALCEAFALSVCSAAGIELDDRARMHLAKGLLPLTRVDVTESWDFGTMGRAIAAVQGVSEMGHLKHRGRGSLLAEGTCYFGRKSRRMAAKAYAKGLELQKHPLPRVLDRHDDLLALVAGWLRVEFTLRGMWLKARGLDLACNWAQNGVTAAGVHAELLSGLNLSEATMRNPTDLQGLPPRLQAIYTAWLDGHDVRPMFKSRATFYRYRAELLRLGVDLAVKRPREASNVIPLGVVLTGRPVSVPDWAIGTPLYWQPQAKLAA